MTAKELEQYLLQSLNMALGSMMQGETSYTNSFTCKVTEEGFTFFLACLQAILWTMTYIKNISHCECSFISQIHIVKTEFCVFRTYGYRRYSYATRFVFPWQQGISERLVISDLDRFTSSLTNQQIPIMKQLTLNYQNITSIAIAGNSGSGKSYMLTYLLVY